MSVDYYMACEKCRECIHVAHDGLSGWRFYSGEPDCMKQLGKFLGDHSLCVDQSNHLALLYEHAVEDFAHREWRAVHNTKE